MHVMNAIHLTVVLSLINIVVSQSPCVTPNGENGSCILLENCEPFIKIWDNRTYQNIGFLRKSHCGFEADKPLVCCGSVAQMTEISVTTSRVTTESLSVKATEPAPLPVSILTQIITEPSTKSNPVTPLPISVSTPQLFTSAMATNTPSSVLRGAISTNVPPIRSVSSSSAFKDHPNFNLLPPRGKCGLQGLGQKITKGNETDLDQYPWLAMLLYKFDDKIVPNCGGSLINKRYVLTAAHCIKANLISVRMGEYNLDTPVDCIIQEGDEVCNDPYQEVEIDDFVRYLGYSNKDVNRYHDIALIRLKREFNYTDYVKPICLPLNNERSNSGDMLTVSGWGLTEKNITSSIKLAVDVPVWSDTSCKELFSIGYGVNISFRQFCAGGQGGRDSCGGDSGGPLMKPFPNAVEFYMEGIVSFGPDPCGRQATPGVYIRVSEYVQWILDSMTPF